MAMRQELHEHGVDLLFRQARTHITWEERQLAADLPQRLYELTKWGPTSVNSNPARFVFLVTQEAKERIKPHLDPGNVEKTMSAPCCVIVAYDRMFHSKMANLMPAIGETVAAFFSSNAEKSEENAFRNSSLQGAYLMLAARALGLDCGPMQGFARDGVDGEFFKGESWTTNFLVNIGYGDQEKVRPRMPRLSFEEACRIL